MIPTINDRRIYQRSSALPFHRKICRGSLSADAAKARFIKRRRTETNTSALRPRRTHTICHSRAERSENSFCIISIFYKYIVLFPSFPSKILSTISPEISTFFLHSGTEKAPKKPEIQAKSPSTIFKILVKPDNPVFSIPSGFYTFHRRRTFWRKLLEKRLKMSIMELKNVENTVAVPTL